MRQSTIIRTGQPSTVVGEGGDDAGRLRRPAEARQPVNDATAGARADAPAAAGDASASPEEGAPQRPAAAGLAAPQPALPDAAEMIAPSLGGDLSQELQGAGLARRKMPQQVKKVLAAQGIPVWLTLMIMISGAVGTYYLAPRVNQIFEAQKLRTEFLIKAVDEINEQTRTLLANISLAEKRIDLNSPDASVPIDKITESVMRLTWNAIFISNILDDDGGETDKLITDYENKLAGTVGRYADPKILGPKTDAERLKRVNAAQEDSTQLMTLTMKLVTRIADAGGLTPRWTKGGLFGP